MWPYGSRYVSLLIVGFLFGAFLCAFCASNASAVAPADFYSVDIFNQLASDGSAQQEKWADEEAAELQRLGIHNIQLNINWRDFEKANCNGELEEAGVHFAGFDRRVRHAAEHGMTAMGGFYGTRVPEHCANGADLHHFPIPGTQMYKDYVFQEGGGYGGGFVWQVVQRYGVNGSFWYQNPSVPYHPIKVWGVWNEMNFGENNPPYGEGIQPQWYAKLLIDTSAAIRKAQEKLIGQNPYNVGTRVLFGGLWGDSQYAQGGEVNWKMGKYLDEVYYHPSGYTATELHNAFDGFSYHPYALHGNANDVINTTGGARAVLDAHGDSNKTLWLTEIGWPVGFNQLSPSHNAQEQSNLLSESLSWIWANREYLKAEFVAVFAYQDYAGQSGCTNSPNCWPYYAGIRDVNGKERPAWCMLANLISSGSCGSVAKIFYSDAPNNNTMTGWAWNSSNGWQQEFLYGHPTAAGTSPAALMVNGLPNVFFVDASNSNTITDWNWNPTEGWHQTFLYGDSVAAGTNPSAVVDANGATHVYFVDANKGNTITEWNSSGGWHQGFLYGDSAVAKTSPSAITEANGTVHVYFADANKGNTITEWNSSGGWHQTFLYGDSVAAGSSPSGVMNGGTPEVYFVDASKGNTITNWSSSGGWHQGFLYGDSVAANTSPSAMREANGTVHVYFVDANRSNTISEWNSSGGWHQTFLYGDSVAAGSSPSGVMNGGTPEVYFVDTNKGNTITNWSSSGGWHQTFLYGHAVSANSSPDGF